MRIDALVKPENDVMPQVMTLSPQPLTRQAFAPFGDVIDCAGRDSFPINQGMADRYHDLAKLDLSSDEGRPAISLVRARPEVVPVRLRLMERHPLATQIFMPLGPQPFLVVVAPTGAPPSCDMLQAFVSDGTQGVNYHRGVWHHPMIALEQVTDFLVVDREGPGNNCDETAIAGGPVEVCLA